MTASSYGDKLTQHHAAVTKVVKYTFIATILLLIVFTFVYSSSIDSAQQHFHNQQELSKMDALYLSVLTQTTVGCTFPQPKSDAAKWTVATQSLSSLTLFIVVIVVLLDS